MKGEIWRPRARARDVFNQRDPAAAAAAAVTTAGGETRAEGNGCRAGRGKKAALRRGEGGRAAPTTTTTTPSFLGPRSSERGVEAGGQGQSSGTGLTACGLAAGPHPRIDRWTVGVRSTAEGRLRRPNRCGLVRMLLCCMRCGVRCRCGLQAWGAAGFGFGRGSHAYGDGGGNAEQGGKSAEHLIPLYRAYNSAQEGWIILELLQTHTILR